MNKLRFKSLTSMWLTVVVGLISTNSLANTSDRLIVLDTDGRSFTTQHTISSSGALMLLDIPGGVQIQNVQFVGPDSATFEQAFKSQPDRIAIWSGSSFVRYGFAYTDEVSQSGPSIFKLTTPSISTDLALEGTKLARSNLTWVFPSDFEIVNFTQVDKETGKWNVVGNTLSYQQLSEHPVMLKIEYQRREIVEPSAADLCSSGAAKIDDCAPDADSDGIPDYRDVCPSMGNSELTRFGCAGITPLVLNDISFASGYSYLNVEARQILDRLAYALQSNADKLYEIGAHTDDQGKAELNKQLSQKRASAVRHYLLLRGVDPNQIRANGYGEEYPLADNATQAGRDQNRRVEITTLN